MQPRPQGGASGCTKVSKRHSCIPHLPLAVLFFPNYSSAAQGAGDDYYNAKNSLLNDVLARKQGIPISLAALHMSVAQRCGLGVVMLNMPMHIINSLPAAAAAAFQLPPLPAGGQGAGLQQSAPSSAGATSGRGAGAGGMGTGSADAVGVQGALGVKEAGAGRGPGSSGSSSGAAPAPAGVPTPPSPADSAAAAEAAAQQAQHTALYIDVFDGGKVMDYEGVRWVRSYVDANPAFQCNASR